MDAIRRHGRLVFMRRSLARQTVFRDRRNPFEIYDDEMYERFRFHRRGVSVIVDLVRDEMERKTKHSCAVPVELQVLVALKFLASGSFFITCGDTVHVHVSTASRIVRALVLALLHHLHKYVRFPIGDEAGSVKETFLRKGGFPGIVGAVDGTHIRIQAPVQHEENYINRKGFHSLNGQVVVDANSYITNVVAKWPGSVHGSRILRSSCIGERFESGHIRGMLLGDSGYPCRPWLMTPFLRPNGHAQEMYNEAHKTSRSVVERAIGQLKRRFACLHGELQMAPERCCGIVVACCILHNLAKQLGIPDDRAEPELQDDSDEQEPQRAPQDGVHVRNLIVQRHFT
ncbi:putative nuclease HARBI1 [Ornithodoros turicata]|uniref:putative nuclease HARBI1 n=2 Tax=Ornithodoros turicata TaxID=34597 RepID=UPI0031389455